MIPSPGGLQNRSGGLQRIGGKTWERARKGKKKTITTRRFHPSDPTVGRSRFASKSRTRRASGQHLLGAVGSGEAAGAFRRLSAAADRRVCPEPGPGSNASSGLRDAAAAWCALESSLFGRRGGERGFAAAIRRVMCHGVRLSFSPPGPKLPRLLWESDTELSPGELKCKTRSPSLSLARSPAFFIFYFLFPLSLMRFMLLLRGSPSRR